MKIVREEIKVKGEDKPRVVELKFSKHGPVFYEDQARHLAFAVRSSDQEPGTAPYKGSFKLAQATSCEDFFDRAMSWKLPSHNLICGDKKGNIALMVTGLAPDRDGWTGRLPVPGTGKYEWKGFRSDLPREYNPARGYIATANDNTQSQDFKGPPVFYKTTRDRGHRTHRPRFASCSTSRLPRTSRSPSKTWSASSRTTTRCTPSATRRSSRDGRRRIRTSRKHAP